ncbi:MAG: undecaprenyl-diphosphate phosphatase [Candidatus Zixiibacteriota bacterium]|nr:MAG: undecaprenyl-diphosphate phosphatase [candidate division Zixibacteria bacterium]
MSYYDAIILGILQGLTEFLPISSSGHLVLAQAILKVKQSGVSFEVLVHLGSLLAVLVYFRARVFALLRSLFVKDMNQERRTVLHLIIATVPAVVAALLFRDLFERAFSEPAFAAIMLLVTGAILISTRFYSSGVRQIRWLSAIVIGISQALAIIPGISRSGITISAGMATGVNPSRAAEFSFLLSIPAIAGAVIFKADELISISHDLIAQYLIGLAITFVASLFAVYAVLATIRRGKFLYFGFYCFAAGAVGLYLFL